MQGHRQRPRNAPIEQFLGVQRPTESCRQNSETVASIDPQGAQRALLLALYPLLRDAESDAACRNAAFHRTVHVRTSCPCQHPDTAATRDPSRVENGCELNRETPPSRLRNRLKGRAMGQVQPITASRDRLGSGLPAAAPVICLGLLHRNVALSNLVFASVPRRRGLVLTPSEDARPAMTVRCRTSNDPVSKRLL